MRYGHFLFDLLFDHAADRHVDHFCHRDRDADSLFDRSFHRDAFPSANGLGDLLLLRNAFKPRDGSFRLFGNHLADFAFAGPLFFLHHTFFVLVRFLLFLPFADLHGPCVLFFLADHDFNFTGFFKRFAFVNRAFGFSLNDFRHPDSLDAECLRAGIARIADAASRAAGSGGTHGNFVFFPVAMIFANGVRLLDRH